jgi:hypothetical protein
MNEQMSARALPGLGEALLYLRNNGLRRSLLKAFSGYLVGREQWYLTREDLTRYIGVPVDADGLEFRFARQEDVPRMTGFMRRMSPQILATWCGREYFFFLTLKDGEAVSYRCLSTLVHPGVVGFVLLQPEQIFMVDEFTVPAYRRRGITRQMAIAMTPVLLRHGFREVLGIHRTDNHDTIAAARAKGIPRIGTITRTCFPWRVSFDYAPSTDSVRAAREPLGGLGERPLARHEAV